MEDKTIDHDEEPEIITNSSIINEQPQQNEQVKEPQLPIAPTLDNTSRYNDSNNEVNFQVENFITETLNKHFESNEILEIDSTRDGNKLNIFQPKSDEMFKDFFKGSSSLKTELNELANKRKNRYTFDFDSFLDVFNQQEASFDPKIFSFVSFTISQLVEIFYKGKKSSNFKENLKKTLSNIFYSLLEDKLLNLFNNHAYSFQKKCVLALVQLVGVWNMYVQEDETIDYKRPLEDGDDDSVVKTKKHLRF